MALYNFLLLFQILILTRLKNSKLFIQQSKLKNFSRILKKISKFYFLEDKLEFVTNVHHFSVKYSNLNDKRNIHFRVFGSRKSIFITLD